MIKTDSDDDEEEEEEEDEGEEDDDGDDGVRGRARARVFFQDCVILPGGTQAKNSRKTCIVWTPPACFAPSVFLFSQRSRTEIFAESGAP